LLNLLKIDHDRFNIERDLARAIEQD